MNFFGHAAVASWNTAAPAFALGAMLPDFATMLHVRLPPVHDAELDAGVAFHVETDRVFHSAPTFVTLERAARSALLDKRVRRGTAVAVAHIGVELMLDNRIADDPHARTMYVRALACADALGATYPVAWQSTAVAQRFSRLIAILGQRGVPQCQPTSTELVERLRRALSGRPRLAVADQDVTAITEWAEATQAVVDHHAPRLLGEVRAGLGLA